MQMHELQQPKRIKCGFLEGPKGQLGFMEYVKTGSSSDHHALPFKPRRIYWVNGQSEGTLRGDHAHLNSSRVFVAIQGEVNIEITFKDGRTRNYTLASWEEGLWVPPGFWYRCVLGKDALLLVISSHTHKQDIYIRDKAQYLAGYKREGDWIYSHNYLPQVYKRSYPLHLYGIRRYQFIASGQVIEVFYLARGSEILGRWPFQLHQKMAISLSGAPYGGFQVHASVPGDVVAEWSKWVLDVLRGMGMQTIRHRPKPDFLLSEQDKNNLDRLRLEGFKELYSDYNQYINVRGVGSALHSMESRKLQKLLKAGARVVEESPENLQEVYYFIAQARTNRQIPLSVNFKQMKQFFEAYPQRYSIYSVFDKRNVRMASCIMVQPDERCWYYFLPATAVEHLSKSPMVLLIQELVEICRSKGLDYLDLGIASVEGHKQKGLFEFKKRMGALESPKRTLELAW